MQQVGGTAQRPAGNNVAIDDHGAAAGERHRTVDGKFPAWCCRQRTAIDDGPTERRLVEFQGRVAGPRIERHVLQIAARGDGAAADENFRCRSLEAATGQFGVAQNTADPDRHRPAAAGLHGAIGDRAGDVHRAAREGLNHPGVLDGPTKAERVAIVGLDDAAALIDQRDTDRTSAAGDRVVDVEKLVRSRCQMQQVGGTAQRPAGNNVAIDDHGAAAGERHRTIDGKFPAWCCRQRTAIDDGPTERRLVEFQGRVAGPRIERHVLQIAARGDGAAADENFRCRSLEAATGQFGVAQNTADPDRHRPAAAGLHGAIGDRAGDVHRAAREGLNQTTGVLKRAADAERAAVGSFEDSPD